MFAAILNERDASRATFVANKLRAHGFTMALTGGLAIEARSRAHGRIGPSRPLNDLAFVVDSFDTIAAVCLPFRRAPCILRTRSLHESVELPAFSGRHLECPLFDELSKRCLIPKLIQLAVGRSRECRITAAGCDRRSDREDGGDEPTGDCASRTLGRTT